VGTHPKISQAEAERRRILAEAAAEPRIPSPEGAADRVREPREPLEVNTQDAKGEATTAPVNRSPALKMDIPPQAKLWPDVDGYAVNSVELAFGGRVELSMSQADRVLAGAVALNGRITLVVSGVVKSKKATAMDKKGSFDGVTGRAEFKVIGATRVEEWVGGTESESETLRNTIDSISARAARVKDNPELVARLIHDLIEHPRAAGVMDDGGSGLSDSLAEATSE
jgi:hypothetical protein